MEDNKTKETKTLEEEVRESNASFEKTMQEASKELKDSLDSFKKYMKELQGELQKPVDKKDIHAAEFKDGAEIVPGQSPEDKSPNATFGEGDKGWTEFLKAVAIAGRGHGIDKRLLALPARSKTMTVGTDSAGGFLVPTEFRPQLIERALEASVIRPGATVLSNIQGDSVQFPAVVDTSHAASVHGGIIGYWTAEAGVKTATQPELGQKKWEAHELVGYTEVSDKLIRFSALSMGQFLTQKLGDAIAWYSDDAFINGSGAGQPLGILNSGCLISVAKEAGQAGTVVPENLSKMMANLHPRAENRAVWLAHPYLREQLMNLAKVMGTAGQMVFMPDYKAKPIWTLCGLPIRFTEKCPAIGTIGDIILADLQEYWIADFGDIEIASSPHVQFKYNITAWRVVLYVDGQPTHDSTLTLKDGTSTVSDFVTIAARP